MAGGEGDCGDEEKTQSLVLAGDKLSMRLRGPKRYCWRCPGQLDSILR